MTNQTSDSASVNIKLATLLGVPHMPCESHLLQNQTKWWMKKNADEDLFNTSTEFSPAGVVTKINALMKSLRTNKLRALLRHQTSLVPTLGNDTRWTSLAAMLNKYEKLRAILGSLRGQPGIELPPETPLFTVAADMTRKILSDINAVVVGLQEHALPLYKCRELQAILIDFSEQFRADPVNHWYDNNFGTTYIKPDSAKRPDQAFANAAVKMQQRAGHTLNREEKLAVKKWIKKPAVDTRRNNHPVSNSTSIVELLQKKKEAALGKRKADQVSVGYSMGKEDSSLDHVIGSAAGVERLWSQARYVLTTSRASMAPIMVEAIMFLRDNRDLWDESTVHSARAAVRDGEREDRLKKKIRLANVQECEESVPILLVDEDGDAADESNDEN